MRRLFVPVLMLSVTSCVGSTAPGSSPASGASSRASAANQEPAPYDERTAKSKAGDAAASAFSDAMSGDADDKAGPN